MDRVSGASSGASRAARSLPPGVRTGSRRDARHAGGEEAVTGDRLRHAGPVQVRRDPAEVEGPARAEDHAEVDVLRLGDHAVVEHEPDLLGERAERTLPDLLL